MYLKMLRYKKDWKVEKIPGQTLCVCLCVCVCVCVCLCVCVIVCVYEGVFLYHFIAIHSIWLYDNKIE